MGAFHFGGELPKLKFSCPNRQCGQDQKGAKLFPSLAPRPGDYP
jgi:hypothetical protein